MGLFKSFIKRSKPSISDSVKFVSLNDYDSLCANGYISMANQPEVKIAVDKIAKLISTMTIHLMENKDNGDIRVHNELSRKIDINPWNNSTRSNFMYNIVSNMLLEGNSFVYPLIKDGLIQDLIPLEPSLISFDESISTKTDGYYIIYQGKTYKNNELLHFLINPDPNKPYIGRSFRIPLKSILDNLNQAQATKKGFLSSKWRPNLIISVDAMTGELATKEGREKVLEKYIESDSAGQPWVIPGGTMEVKEIRPLSLKDLAINEGVEIDKKTVASIFGIPSFILGIGEFNKDEYNSFIDSTILPIARVIEQELTKKLLLSRNMYFRFNPRSLYAYSTTELAGMGSDLYTKGIITGNEVRDLIGFGPLDQLDELIILENYIPLEESGNQKKLGGEED